MTMQTLAHWAGRLGGSLNWAVERICALLVAAMVLIVWAGVVSRYLIEFPAAWTEEVARYLMIWAALLAVSCGVYYREHIGLAFLLEAIPERMRGALLVVIDLIGVGFFGVLLVYGIRFSMGGLTEYAMVTNMTMWLPYAAVPVAAGLSLLQQLLATLRDVGRAAQRGDLQAC